MEVVDFHLEQIIGNTRGLIRDKVAAKGLHLYSEIDPALPLVMRGDPLRLGQILLNFAGNAVKFTEQGSVGISAKLVVRDGERLRVRFEIRDTGIGMSEEHIALLFQEFVQADASTTRKFGGTGLGLAISQRLIPLMAGDHGSDICVDSQLGVGSTFWFEIPLLEGITSDGAEALRLVQRHDYDLVLMDVQMPVMDGINDHLAKPFDPETLYAAMIKWLSVR